MVEILKALVDILAKAVPALNGSRRKRQLNAIGADLFTIYFRLNEVLVTAERIIRALEGYVMRMGEHLATGGDRHALTAGEWIRQDLEQQSINLSRVSNLLRAHDVQLFLIDADAFAKLAPLIDRKSGAMSALVMTISRGQLPVRPSVEDLRFLMSTEDMLHPSREFHDVVRHIHTGGVPTDRPWGEETYRIVTAYLNERDPKAQLAEIRQAVGQLREALLRHFSVEDMLLAVGDRRFGA